MKKYIFLLLLNIIILPYVPTNEHIARIMEVFDTKTDADHFAKSVDYDAIAKNDYNLSVSSYVQAKDTREIVDITELNKEIKTTVSKIDLLVRPTDR